MMRPQSGFTLVEMMIALSVLAIGLSGIASLRNLSVQHLERSQEIREVSYFAKGHLDKLQGQAGLKTGVLNGYYPLQGNQALYEWRLSLRPAPDDSFEPVSPSLTDKVQPFYADLTVLPKTEGQELVFHALILAAPQLVDQQRAASITNSPGKPK